LSLRAYNALKRGYCDTIGDVIGLSDAQILDLPNAGPHTVEDIDNRLLLAGHIRQNR
jgi:DNA-directed RNA polymerase alpha subunit